MTDKTFDALENAASATECTGLMPALETDHAANEASASLQGIHTAKIEKQRKDAACVFGAAFRCAPHGAG